MGKIRLYFVPSGEMPGDTTIEWVRRKFYAGKTGGPSEYQLVRLNGVGWTVLYLPDTGVKDRYGYVRDRDVIAICPNLDSAKAVCEWHRATITKQEDEYADRKFILDLACFSRDV